MNRRYIIKYSAIALYVFLIFGVFSIPHTNARMSDTEDVSHASLTAATWGESGTRMTDDSPSLSLSVSRDRTYASFLVDHIAKYSILSYTLTYDTETVPNGIQGQSNISGDETFERQHIILGTCSTGGTCTYHHGVSNLKLTVTLTENNGNKLILESSL